MMSKTCNGCKKTKAIDQFGKDNTRGDGKRTQCKECVRARNNEWRAANPEKFKKSLSKSRKKIYKTVKERMADGTLVTPDEITCAKCRETKPNAEFYRSASNSTGRQSYCKPCAVDKSRVANIKRLYGLSEEEYEAMLEACGGMCQICEKRPVEAVDHCHDTGKVRGLLCGRCNMGLGHFYDDVEALKKAIKYLS
jgi:ribosomal protein S20